MKDPMVVVVIPAYNAAKFIGECLDSIEAQTYNNTEIVVCNDQSTDETLKMAMQHKGNKRLHVIQNRVRQGPPGAFNACVRYARDLFGLTGDWIVALQAADDVSLPTRIERSVEYLQDNPHDRIMSCNVTDYATDDYHVLTPVLRNAKPHSIPILGVVSWSSVYNQIGLHRNRTCADRDWCQRCKDIGWGIVEDRLYRYRNHPDQDNRRPFVTTFPFIANPREVR